MSRYTEAAEACLRHEAQALLGLVPLLDEGFDRAVNLILNCSGKLIITGVGKSGHIGAKIAATMSSTGTPSFFMPALDAFHGDLGVVQKGDVVLAISNSGQTDELLRFIPLLRQREIPVIGMSGNPASLLAKYSDAHLNVAVDREADPNGLAPTSSTTATLAMGDALACALVEARHFGPEDFACNHPGGSLGRRLLTTAADVMRSEDLPVVSSGTSLPRVVERMSAGRLGLAVVTTDDSRVEGIITDGDIRRAMERLRADFFEAAAADIMSSAPQCVGPDSKVADIQDLLYRRKIHAVLVTESSGVLLGVVDNFALELPTSETRECVNPKIG